MYQVDSDSCIGTDVPLLRDFTVVSYSDMSDLHHKLDLANNRSANLQIQSVSADVKIQKLMSVKEENNIQKKELLNLKESYSLLKVCSSVSSRLIYFHFAPNKCGCPGQSISHRMPCLSPSVPFY